ncbi:hypothetical protein [Leptospira sp. GIMC2001]|uniref:hypothetical protein n=1 Tax=Leptospira sp. GIMC2001 TaxID=1513297 RepID=UPI0023499C0E|nr:hypothetical protein [Leptospira sp. GIMC2001]WCL48422.1 hypothetical protein O4O04_14070 [Leptospira sp. GIMC2001]
MAERKFKYFLWNPETDDRVFQYLSTILKDGGYPTIVSEIYTMVKDLILNGLKANYKRLFFQDAGLDIHHISDYELGVRMYKSRITSGSLPEFSKLAETNDLWVEASIDWRDDGLKIIVTNNMSMVAAEMLKIRSALMHAQNYDDIMEYYLERADDSEGEGIGIALIVIIMKSLQVELQNFQIFNEGGYTIAQIFLPWSSLDNSKR